MTAAIDKRSRIDWETTFLFIVVTLCLNSALHAESPRPNIILIMSDDQGWNQVGYYDHPHLKGKTPNLNAMAANGIRFDRFYAGASVCTPTRGTVITGRTSGRNGAAGLHQRLCLQEKTLPQALKKAGYTTAHFGKWHLNGVKGSAMPILPDDPNHPGHYGIDHWLSATNYIEMDPLMTRNGEFVGLKGESSILMVEETLKFIEANQEKPFFSMIWYGSPHFPYTALQQDIDGLSGELDSKTVQLFGEIIAMDRSIGMLRNGLKDMGLAENTLIWFCSDNGGREHDPDSVGELRGFKGVLYEGGIRVPGIIEWPGKIKPQVTSFPASTLDIMPTLVDLLDLPADSMMDVYDGESILPLFEGKTPERKHSIPFTSKGTVLIDGNFKLIRSGRGKGVKWELYDLKTDPTESTDISAQQPERLQTMIAEAEALVASVAASAEGKDYPEGSVIQPQRGTPWFEMKEYEQHYETFKQLKPTWKAPGKEKKPKKKKQ